MLMIICGGAELYSKMSDAVSKSQILESWRFPSEIKYCARKPNITQVQIYWDYLIKIGFVKDSVSIQNHNSGLTCDTGLCYHRKIKQLILGRYCRYHHYGSF